jgi:hypothetical protein
MPQYLEDKIPNQGMNQDDENRLVNKQESRYILNLRAGASDGDNVGAIENIKGTTEVTFDLPKGKCKVIGSYGDQTTNSNFFFLWSSIGEHTIYRYFPEDRTVRILSRDSIWGWTEFDLINDIKVINGELLYFRDLNNPPRKINIIKADNDDPNTFQEFNWYLGDKYLENETTLDLHFTVKPSRHIVTPFTATTVASHTFSVLTTNDPTKTDIARDLAEQINNGVANNTITVAIKAEACGEYVKITTTSTDYFTIVAHKNSQATAQVVPQNHYISYIERTIDVIKHPPHCEITGSVQTDTTFHRNYIAEKVFQFATRVIYDDNEKSTVNPHSIHVYNKFYCPQFSAEDIYNYIKLDLSDIDGINDLNHLQSIRSIEIFAREGELGNWKTIAVLNQHEFIDTEDQHYNFYNDGHYAETDQSDFVRPFDLVPQRTKCMEVTKNRMFFGNNLEGYDNTCVDGELTVTYDDVEDRLDPPTYTVSGRIYIRAAFNGHHEGALKDHQPIWRDSIDDNYGGVDNPIVWGGVNEEPLWFDPRQQNISGKSGQILPLGGFLVYLAGTDYYGISKQRTGYSGLDHVSQDSNGVFQGDGDKHYVNGVRDYIVKEDEYGELYSEFTIEGVPDGWYSMRVASHTTTQEDLDSGSRVYQDTSTNVFQMYGTASGHAEQKVGVFELIVRVNGGNIDGYHIDIMDLTHTSQHGSSKILTGYVACNDNGATGNDVDYTVAVNDTRFAFAQVRFNLNANVVKHASAEYAIAGSLDASNWANNFWFDDANTITDAQFFVHDKLDGTVTDHNGYFFFGSMQPSSDQPDSSGKLSVESVNSYREPKNVFSATPYASGRGTGTTSEIPEDSFSEIALRLTGDFKNNRVWVKGFVVDQNGLGIPQASVVSNGAPVAQTDSDGEYGFWHFRQYDFNDTDHFTHNFQWKAATIIFASQSGRTCSATYDNQVYDFDFDYPNLYAGNNLNSAYINNLTQSSTPIEITVPNFVGDTEAMESLNAFKRGFEGRFGIVYYDRGLRSGAVNTEEKLKLHIPFDTELDSDELLKNGVPSVSWEIKHRPPAWATHWQWVRTKNLKVGNFWQWAADEINYTDDDGNVTTLSAGTRMAISYNNVSTYVSQFPSADFEAEFSDPGKLWRVRFIKRADGTRLQEYLDFPIIAVSDGIIYIEKDFSLKDIDDGAVFEAYASLLEIPEDTYYEFGECFEVGITQGLTYHKGQTQDQNPLQPASVPATGTFRTGDVYYRLRGIPGVQGANQVVYICDDAISDFYKSQVDNTGRVNGVNPDASQLWKPTQIRHSGKWIIDSRVNNLSRFVSDDYKTLSIDFGAIHKLILSSNILMSIHEFRWVSNYIEEAIIRKQAGDNDLVATTDVFGSERAAKQISGTINQESVAEYRGSIWAWDANKGEVSRWAADGLTTISHYKMMNYFTDKGKEIKKYTNLSKKPPLALGFFDTKHDEYILSFSEMALVPLTDDPVEDTPTYRVGVDVNNSETVEAATDDTLYTINGSKNKGSVFILDEATAPNLKGVQIDNQEDSDGPLDVKVKTTDGVILDVVKLQPGQGIANFEIQSRGYDPKQGSDDNTQSIPPGTIFVQAETIAFAERLNKWTTFYSFKPEMFGSISLEMLGFKDGKLWVHNDNDTRNNFYGEQFTSQLEALFHEPPGQVKVFKAIGVESYHPWSVPKATTPNGRQTEIKSGRFVKREDSFFAPVMRDVNDPRFANQYNEAIVNGRELRDRTIKVLLENTETSEVVLFAVSMKSTLSSRHQK